MDDYQFRQLVVVFSDFFSIDIDDPDIKSTLDAYAGIADLRTLFKFERRIYEQDDIFTPLMSYVLHEYMFVLCTNMDAMRALQKWCPAYLFMLTQIDKMTEWIQKQQDELCEHEHGQKPNDELRAHEHGLSALLRRLQAGNVALSCV